MHKVVVILAIPGVQQRGKDRMDGGIPFLEYSYPSWRYWCDKHGIELVVFDRPFQTCRPLPPVVQRWLIPEAIVRERGEEVHIAMVDADTMIRHDTPPDFFCYPECIAVVRDGNPKWIKGSVEAYQRYFQMTDVAVAEYFNAGMVVFSSRFSPVLNKFVEYYTEHYRELSAVSLTADWGIDQTPLNLYLSMNGIRTHSLPACYNQLLNCSLGDGLPRERLEQLLTLAADCLDQAVANVAMLAAFCRNLPEQIYAFTEKPGIWHFTLPFPYNLRTAFMAETWSRVCQHYR